ncbi:MAG: gamma-glutamyltransferase [Lawsonibacter sp.]|nr:gamma-glutamyltransferase [Lawsonibacter sp.]
MKKKLALVLATAMVLTLLNGCGSVNQSAASSTSVSSASLSQAEEEFRLVADDGTAIDNVDRSAIGQNGVVSSARYEASKIGVEIMKAGGNAVDAAVATAFAVGVCEPFSNGIGGGGFMTLHLEDGSNIFIDFREYAPAAANEDMFMNADGTVNEDAYTYGGLSSAIPGTVAGLLYILDQYGTMSREQVMRPAVELAQNGYVVNPLTKWALDYGYSSIKKNPGLAAIYTNDQLPLDMGDTIMNPNLAKALKLIIDKGSDGFYKGELAEALVKANNEAGGVMTMDDLSNYHINVLKPVAGTYRGYQVISSPLPSSGGTHLIQILNILENFDIGSMTPYSAKHVQLLAEAEKIAYADRAAYMGDPNYVDVPVEGLISKEYAAKLAAKIDMNKPQEYEADDPWAFEGNDTQHLSVADKAGNMVAITMSLNDYWGSRVLVDGYGFVLNNHMNDFDATPGGPNSVAAGKKPLSSMSPTIVLNEDGSPFMVLGCPGGSSIFPQVAQVISDVIDFDMDMQEAVDQPRIIDDLTNVLEYQDDLSADVVKQLEATGYQTESIGNDEFGYVQAVLYGKDGMLHGAADSFADGAAVGY